MPGERKVMKNFKYTIGIGAFLVIAGILFLYHKEDNTGGERLQEVYRTQNHETEDTKMETTYNSGELNAICSRIENRTIVESFSEAAKRTGDENADNIYEEWYGGAYIEGSKLIVCVTDESKISDFDEDIVQNVSVEFQKVTYSLNELHGFQDDIEKKYKKYYAEYQGTDTPEFEVVSSIAGIGLSHKGNKIVIDFVQVTPEKKKVFRRLFGDYEYIELNHVSDRNYDA